MNILVNAMKTPDGTIIESLHRHDYVTHLDKIDGITYMVDGGTAYLRRSSGGNPEDMSVYSDDDHGVIRERFTWGTRGVLGDQPLIRMKLMDLSTPHIEAIIKTQFQIPRYIKDIFEEELRYRDIGE